MRSIWCCCRPAGAAAPRLAMLRRDLDFVPTTPKKGAARVGIGLGTPRAPFTPAAALRSPTKRGSLFPGSGGADGSPTKRGAGGSGDGSPVKLRRGAFASAPDALGSAPVPSENVAPPGAHVAVPTPRVVTKSTQEKKA